MKLLFKQWTVYCIIASYSIVGFVGHFASLNELVNYVNNGDQFAQEAKSFPVHHKPVWTKKRHVLPTTQTNAPLHSLSSCIILPNIYASVDVVNNNDDFIVPFLNSSSSKPRDPPVI